jgi:hypothetical protein
LKTRKWGKLLAKKQMIVNYTKKSEWTFKKP